jgi:hypothetical protein
VKYNVLHLAKNTIYNLATSFRKLRLLTHENTQICDVAGGMLKIIME